MPQQTINLGAAGSGAGGDSARTAFEKASANFAELYIAALPGTAAQKQAARDMFGLGTAATKAAQTGPADTTAGALMAVGAFGVGAKNSSVTPSVGSSGLLSGIRENGLYRITSTNPDSPLGSSIGQLLHAGQAADYAAQVAFKGGAGGTGKEAFWRNIDAGTASAWQMFYLQSNILGTVSQAGGVPTGAIIERGSNANGEYVRFADGTQICWMTPSTALATPTATGSGFQSASALAVDFPAVFSAAPVAAALAAYGGSGSRGWLSTSAITTARVDLIAHAFKSDGTVVARCVAVGRWFN